MDHLVGFGARLKPSSGIRKYQKAESSPWAFSSRRAWGLLLLLLLCLVGQVFSSINTNNKKLETRDKVVAEVRNWALRFGKNIQQLSSEVTCLRTIKDNFNNSGADVEWVEGTQMLDEMRSDVQHMVAWKRQAVERMVDVAEYAAKAHAEDKNIKHDFMNAKYFYDPRVEAKPAVPVTEEDKWKALDMAPHRNYDGANVSLMNSAIHVPTNVYDAAPDILNAIKWSEYMNPTFRNNMAVDPSLSWQFFGSSTGFLRLHPAAKWRTGEDPDLFDCRMRPWFIQAAASAKDVVILVDGSGSMTGLRKAIARDVVMNILDTLTDNDFVTVLRFSDVIQQVVECFKDVLVQANEKNIQEFKDNIDKFSTVNIANFTLGLTSAFELLQKYHRTQQGSQCNQAIMLITDGAPYTYEEIFQQYNWPNIDVRVFTYLIGREVTDNREVNWMACANKGYYTHVANLAEVREQVQKYIPVMSRPIVLSGFHPYIWTPVYADVAANEMLAAGKAVHLLTTVAMPVFDKRNYSTSTSHSARAANLLGVAGTDVPIREILKMTPAYKLGVNGYSFAITNNGYILFHPDLRVLFQDMLKPGYGSVDLTEVELVDNNQPAREIDETLRLIRQNMIDRKIGWNPLAVKVHMDNMRRVVTRNNTVYYGPIDGTPFSLAIVLPSPYGHYQVVGRKEVKRKEEDWMKYFLGNNWRVHPEWVYCDFPPKTNESDKSPEDTIRSFLIEALGNQTFRWRTSSLRPPIFDKPVCERDLVQSLVFDAIATFVEEKRCAVQNIPAEYKDSIIKSYGIMTTFVATRSGLLRFQDHRSEEEKVNSTEKAFHEINTKSIEELFYRRAVDFHRINSSAFIFSVPFDAGAKNNSLVTGSHAIYLGTGKQKAPVAVVGLQFLHSTFADAFFNATSKCMSNCEYKCSDDELDCYLLDNNGFVVVSEQHDHTGRFFGEIDYSLFNAMIEYEIYRDITLFDYQAICLDTMQPSGPGNSIYSNPLGAMSGMISWTWRKLATLMVQYSVYTWWPLEVEAAAEYKEYEYSSDGSEDEKEQLNKSKPRGCDKSFTLYEMQKKFTDEPVTGHLFMCHSSGCDKDFIVQRVPYTNLVMLVAYTVCPCEATSESLEPKEVIYNDTLRCARMKTNIYRDRPRNCINKHQEEGEIQQCGNCSSTQASVLVLFASFLLILVNYQRLLA